MKDTCPYCQAEGKQVKNGRNPSGSQKYKCKACHRVHTPSPKPVGYAAEVREEALRLYVDGLNLRRIARILGVNHQSVANWVKAAAQELPPAPVPDDPKVIELDELFTFVEKKRLLTS